MYTILLLCEMYLNGPRSLHWYLTFNSQLCLVWFWVETNMFQCNSWGHDTTLWWVHCFYTTDDSVMITYGIYIRAAAESYQHVYFRWYQHVSLKSTNMISEHDCVWYFTSANNRSVSSSDGPRVQKQQCKPCYSKMYNLSKIWLYNYIFAHLI